MRAAPGFLLQASLNKPGEITRGRYIIRCRYNRAGRWPILPTTQSLHDLAKPPFGLAPGAGVPSQPLGAAAHYLAEPPVLLLLSSSLEQWAYSFTRPGNS